MNAPVTHPATGGHTPGPLKVVRGADWWDREVWTDGPCYTRPICKLSESEAEREEIEANARLFACAPELLDVVQTLHILARLKFGNLDPDANKLFERAESAIAKATGTQP